MRSAFAALVLAVSIGGVGLTFVTIRTPMRVRPNFDLVRLGIALVTIVVITAVSPIATEPGVAAAAVALVLGGGWMIGRRSDIWDDDGALWFRRAPASGSWSEGRAR